MSCWNYLIGLPKHNDPASIGIVFFGHADMATRQAKRPYDLSDMLRRIEKAVKPFPKAAMFELYERGYTSLFEQLISCVISIRTLDETTIPVSERLFQQ